MTIAAVFAALRLDIFLPQVRNMLAAFSSTLGVIIALAPPSTTSASPGSQTTVTTTQASPDESQRLTEEVKRNGHQIEKLTLKIGELKSDQTSKWPPIAVSAVVTLIGIGVSYLLWRGTKSSQEQIAHLTRTSQEQTATLGRTADLDQAVHEKRLEAYPRLTAAMEPLAIYFPHGLEQSTPSPTATVSSSSTLMPSTPLYTLSTEDCRKMGHAMSRWYFTDGGLLLRGTSRDAYFLLQWALTQLSTCNDARFERSDAELNVDSVEEKRGRLGLTGDLPSLTRLSQFRRVASVF